MNKSKKDGAAMMAVDRTARTACVGTRGWLALLCAAIPAGCGAGTAAAISSGGGGSGGNAPPSMSGFTVLDPKVPAQAHVRFVLSDAESDPATVELFYQAPGQPVQPLTKAGANPAVLATSSQGVEHVLAWDFADELDLPSDAHFVDGVQVFARIAGGIQELVLGANGTSIALGNDAPVVSDITVPAQEVVGIVGVECKVTDSSNDAVSIQVEYDIQGDVPDAGWQLARPALADATPTFAIDGVVANHLGTTVSFFWDTNVDLPELEHDVKLRFKARDAVVAGDSAESLPFHVDNNAEPIATVSGDLLLLNDDERRGIPIPFTVRDEESDEVQLVFQWKHANESYPPLPSTPEAIHTILADPIQRRLSHICSELPTSVAGSVVPVDSTSVRLPELASSAATILADGIVGRELEILRASKIPQPIAATWSANPIDRPVAALPVGAGIDALILDNASAGAWRLRQIALGTGVVTRVLVPSSRGEPDAMAFDHDQASVLVASDVGGAWQISRVNLSDGSVSTLVAFDGSTEQGRVRGMTSLGTSAALFTVGSSLVRASWIDPRRPISATVLDGLAMPWGIVLDPLNTNRIYLAERDAETEAGIGRVLWIRLDTLESHSVSEQRIPILDDVFEHIFFDHPGALALERSGARLLVVTQNDPSSETCGVQALELGRGGANRTFSLVSGLPHDIASIATGADGLVLLAPAGANDLAVGGGVEQSRTIESYDSTRQIASASPTFDPAPQSLERFRIKHRSSLSAQSSPAGKRGTFVWDSSDVHDRNDVLVRATPMDAEVGIDGGTDGQKTIRLPFDGEPSSIGNAAISNGYHAVAHADLDGDGDVDLVAANSENHALTIYFQESPGVFAPAPTTLGNAAVTPTCVAPADLDGDGDIDLVATNSELNALTIFFQESPGVFGLAPLLLGAGSGAFWVAPADLDGDGDLDLVCATTNGIAIFFQQSPGVFGQPPSPVGVGFSADCVVPADLDGDGDLDLVAAVLGGSTLYIFFQESPGVFGPSPSILSVCCGSASHVAAADLDGDGDLDLVSANGVGANIVIYFQESPGVFGSTPTFLNSSTVTNVALHVEPADLDGDGDLDLVSANSNNKLSIYYQESPGVFGATPITLGELATGDGSQSVAVADLDGDGDVDLVSADNGSETLTIYSQDNRGGFGPTPTTLGGFSTTNVPWFIASGDLDGDGDLDLVSANLHSATLTIFSQESPGVFGSTPTSPGSLSPFGGGNAAPTSVTVADMDGDGDLDLVSTTSLNALFIFFQERPGVFGPSHAWVGDQTVMNQPASVAAADLDGDGDLDLVSANYTSDTLTIFFQESPGVFAPTPTTLGDATVTNGAFSVAAADLDGDGDLDLVSANVDGNSLTIFFQLSPGVFASTPISLGDATLTLGPESVAAADLDGDGDLDLVSANILGSTLTVFFQVSPGVFGPTPTILGDAALTAGAVSVAAADVDGDGNLDLVSANQASDTLTVFHQESPGVFSRTPTSLGNATVTDGPQSVVAADFDGDGDIDVASVNFWSNTLTVFWGAR